MISVLLGMGAILVGTWLGTPTLAAVVVGAIMGLLLREHPAGRAALAGVLAWTSVLLVAALRGDELGALGKTLGGAMGAPPWAIVIATLLYPTILAASAAWLAHLATRRRARSIVKPVRETPYI